VEFLSPIRIRWDLDHRGRAGRTKRIARRLREAGPLVVSARVDGPRGLRALPAVVAEFDRGSTCLEVTIRLSPEGVRAARWRYPVGLVWAVDGARPFAPLLPPGAKAVSFTPEADAMGRLAGVLREFAASGAETLHLPNVNAVRALAEGRQVPAPSAEEIAEAARDLEGEELDLGRKRLVVHDYFLWRALRGLFPAAAGERVEYSGCQAATALAYVDWDGNVYPCESLPVRLGNLAESSLEEIWAQPARRRLAEALRSIPASCRECPLVADCLGGCRGLAYAAASPEGPDPACPAPPRPPPGAEGLAPEG